jgi:hypothetical protein
MSPSSGVPGLPFINQKLNSKEKFAIDKKCTTYLRESMIRYCKIKGIKDVETFNMVADFVHWIEN